MRAFSRRATGAGGAPAARGRAHAGRAPPGSPGRTPRASPTCCRRYARPSPPASAPPIYRSRPCCPSVRAALEGAEALDVACFDDVQAIAGLAEWERRCSRCGRARWSAARTLLFAARENPAQVDFGLAGPEVAPGVVGGVRGARAERRGAARGAGPARAACAASNCRPRPRVTCSEGFRATCARCARCWTRSTMRRSPRSAASPCRSSATSIAGPLRTCTTGAPRVPAARVAAQLRPRVCPAPAPA